MDRQTWIAACAHRLQRQWRTVDPEQLEEVAGELWSDAGLRELEPVQAALCWLAPLCDEEEAQMKKADESPRQPQA